MLEDAHGTEVARVLKYNFPVSNNELEYENALGGLRMALAMNIK